VIRKKDGIVFRKIHGLFYLIDIKCNYTDDKCFFYELNEIGAYLWNSIDTFNTIESLAHNLYEQIVDDVDEAVIIADVQEYMSVLENEGFVEFG